MLRVAAGDTQAFAGLYDRHAGLVLGLLTRMLGGDGSAEEVLQETFLQAWEQAARYDEQRASARGWLLMMARSRALDRLRSRRSRQERDRVSIEEGLLAYGAVAPEGPSRIRSDETTRAVAEALAALPPEQGRAVELAFFDGLTHTQVAEVMNCPVGTAKSRILLGLRKLRSTLAPYQI
ncbi:MAG: RNA polymerase sigma factor [Thermoanaerobaculia bacterium]